ncbi:MAG: hypothetical protein M3Z32_11990 [Acidobacteriota bacterium]|nr:hypothetical protein [Acidobacteriota bacterium]
MCADIGQLLPEAEDSSSFDSQLEYFEQTGDDMDVAFLKMWSPLMPTAS